MSRTSFISKKKEAAKEIEIKEASTTISSVRLYSKAYYEKGDKARDDPEKPELSAHRAPLRMSRGSTDV